MTAFYSFQFPWRDQIGPWKEKGYFTHDWLKKLTERKFPNDFAKIWAMPIGGVKQLQKDGGIPTCRFKKWIRRQVPPCLKTLTNPGGRDNVVKQHCHKHF